MNVAKDAPTPDIDDDEAGDSVDAGAAPAEPSGAKDALATVNVAGDAPTPDSDEGEAADADSPAQPAEASGAKDAPATAKIPEDAPAPDDDGAGEAPVVRADGGPAQPAEANGAKDAPDADADASEDPTEDAADAAGDGTTDDGTAGDGDAGASDPTPDEPLTPPLDPPSGGIPAATTVTPRVALDEATRAVRRMPAPRVPPTPDAPWRTPAAPPRTPAAPWVGPEPSNAESSSTRPAVLAADPGPLPFAARTTTPEPDPTHRRLLRAGVAVLLALLVVAGLLGGYALTRTIGGAPVFGVVLTLTVPGGTP